MSIYPTYALQVYSFSQHQWAAVAHVKPSNRPHTYDKLRAEFDRLVASAKVGRSPSAKPIGYRITVRSTTTVDVWTCGHGPDLST